MEFIDELGDLIRSILMSKAGSEGDMQEPEGVIKSLAGMLPMEDLTGDAALHAEQSPIPEDGQTAIGSLSGRLTPEQIQAIIAMQRGDV
jgi:hypothetical protein